LESAPAPLVSTYAYVTPLVGAVIGATVLNEPLWVGAFVGGALVLGAVALELRGPMRPRPPRAGQPERDDLANGFANSRSGQQRMQLDQAAACEPCEQAHPAAKD